MTNKASNPSIFLLGGQSPGAIGFDGMGAIDIVSTETDLDIKRPAELVSYRDEVHPLTSRSTPRIIMRRAVRPFDLWYEEQFNAALIAPHFYEEHRPLLEPSLSGITAVTCQFGARARPYVFANLRHVNCRETHIDWSRSSFKCVDNARFVINRTRIARGEVPPDHEVAYEAEGLRFRDYDHFLETKRSLSLRWLIPESLALKIEAPCSIVNLSAAETIFCEPLADALRARKRPKTEVAGMAFSNPRIPVVFGRT